MTKAVDSAEQAETAFYAAFQSGNLEAMAALWEQSDSVVCVHPQGPQLLGYDRVMKSWERILSNTDGFRISAEVLGHYTDGQLSVRFVNETVFDENTSSEPVTLLATNAYRKTESGWRIVLHHASPKPGQARERSKRRTEGQASDVTLH